MDFALVETAGNSVTGLTDNDSAWRSGWGRVEFGDAAAAVGSLLGTSRRAKAFGEREEAEVLAEVLAKVLVEASERQEQEAEAKE
jgi:hypothetical protein